MKAVANDVRRRRSAAGLGQEVLAIQVGLSRQSLGAIEAGRSVPSTEVALRLARALRCAVEDLFWTVEQQSLEVEVVPDSGDDAPPAASDPKGRGSRARPATRAVLGSIAGRWVAHRLSAANAGTYQTAADALLPVRPATAAGTTTRARLLGDARRARETLLCAGCAPAFGLLAARARLDGAGRLEWLERDSRTALELLARGQVHFAGAHLFDDARGEFNVPFVQQRMPDRHMLLFHVARWESGLAVAPGNPRHVRGVRDLARADVTFIGRQPGAAAQELVERLLRREGLPAQAPHTRAIAHGHHEAARLVALGVGDAAITLQSMAVAQGLDFVPLAEERFDIIVEKSAAADPRMAGLLETVCGRSFRRELEALGGHITRDAGKLIADTGNNDKTRNGHGHDEHRSERN